MIVNALKIKLKENKLLSGFLYPIRLIRNIKALSIQKNESAFLKKTSSKVINGSITISVPDYRGEFEIDFRSDILHRLLIYNDYEREIVKLIEKYINPNMDVLDVGSNIGLHSVLFSKIINSNRRVLAFEPTPHAFKFLLKNIKHNKAEHNIIVYNGIATDKEGFYDLNVIEGMEEYSAIGKINHPNVVEKKAKTIKVKGNTIDALVEEYNLNPGLIKIDTEGAENFVFNGALKTIGKYKPIIISELSTNILKLSGLSSETIINQLKNFNYKIYDVATFEEITENFEGYFIAIPTK